MQTLSKKTQYTLRALYSLSRKYGGAPVLISRLAEEESIPKKFLEQILLGLKYQGLVDSKRGKGGGYFLLSSPEKITLGSVIRMIDGPLAPLPCASETAYRKCEECPDARVCGTRIIMREVRDATANILDNTTLADVCRRIDAALDETQHSEALMYYI
jgi:Rrf2 family protein